MTNSAPAPTSRLLLRLRPVRWPAAATALVMALACTACGSSKPPVPDWQMNAHSAAAKAIEAYLNGNARVDKLEWERARAEVARTGRPDLLARLELMRCAAQVASLVPPGPCEAFEPLRADAAEPERAYADYLAGRASAAQVALLPEAQRKAASASGDGAALAGIEDPLSRLVAAGVMFRSDRATPAAVAEAVRTASQQGWRRPLLAWLGVELQLAQAAGNAEAAAAVRRRLAVVEQGISSTAPR